MDELLWRLMALLLMLAFFVGIPILAYVVTGSLVVAGLVGALCFALMSLLTKDWE